MSITQEIETALAKHDTATVFALLDQNLHVINDQIAPGNTFTFLIEACRRRYSDIVAGLIERGAEVNRANAVDDKGEGGNTPIWFACQGGNPGDPEIVTMLISHGADIDARGENGWSALHRAYQWGHVERARILIEKGGDTSCIDNDGRSPLEWATGKVSDDILKELATLPPHTS